MLSSPENLFTHTFPATIWRILPHPDPGCDQWVAELRDAPQQRVSWVLLDMASRQQCWHTTPDATNWWSTLAGFSDRHVLLHNYRSPAIPEPTDLLAVSAADGQLSWALPGWIYAGEAPVPERIVVARKLPESVEYRLCNTGTGIPGSPAATQAAATPPGIREPVRYEPHDVYFEVLSSFLGKIAHITSPIAIDYLEADPYVVFSYYLYEQEKVAQYLLVSNRRREVVFHEQLSANRQGVGRNTLLWKAGQLVCLRHHHELISLKLIP